MTISLPDEIVYYYQSPDTKDRLLCWIPPGELKKLVDQTGSSVDKKILEDFKHGLDIEINDAEIKYYSDKYKLSLNLSADDIRNAFDWIQQQAGKQGSDPSYYVRFDELNEYARKKVKPSDIIADIANSSSLHSASLGDNEERMHLDFCAGAGGEGSNIDLEETLPGVEAEKISIDKDKIADLFNVKFSKGDKDPLTSFSSLQKRSKKG